MPTVNCLKGQFPYTIRPGDTLYRLAINLGTTVEDIVSANPDIEPERLSPGQVICIPTTISQSIDFSSNYYVIASGDTLYKIAQWFGVSLQELMKANPGIRPYNLYVGQVILIPPAASPVSITVGVRAKRLTLYRDRQVVRIFPVATGKPSTPTPIGTFLVVNKQVNPGGPFGTRWMGLSKAHYGIHGTNDPSSIGKSVSNGCIRLYNEDVNQLFNMVPVATVVTITP